MKLNSKRVETIFMDCLFKDGEDTVNYVRAEGIICNVAFHPQRLERYKDEITELLAELPEEFQKSVGGGWSFLNACNDKHGNQWTGEHIRMEQLFQLGVGTGAASLQMPRDVWPLLPGGMPYYVVNDELSE